MLESSLLQLLVLVAGAGLDASGSGAVDVVLGDPALIVVLARAGGSASGLGAGEGLSSLDLLGLLGGAGALGLGEESLDPGLVDEVEGTGEGGGKEEVEEDAIDSQIAGLMGHWHENIHLGVEEAGGGLNNGSGSVVDLDLVDVALGVGDNSNKTEENILRLHVEGKGKGELLLLAGGNLKVVLDGRQVADDGLVGGLLGGELLGSGEGAADKGDLDGAIVAVVDLDDGLCGTTVDELDTKDVGLGEAGADIGLELGDIGRRGVGIRSVLKKVLVFLGMESKAIDHATKGEDERWGGG